MCPKCILIFEFVLLYYKYFFFQFLKLNLYDKNIVLTHSVSKVQRIATLFHVQGPFSSRDKSSTLSVSFTASFMSQCYAAVSWPMTILATAVLGLLLHE